MQIKDYIDSNKERFLDELYDLLRIESVSADPKFKDSVDRASDYLVDQFNKLNLDSSKSESSFLNLNKCILS